MKAEKNMSRKAAVKIIYEGNDISADIASGIRSFSYTDAKPGEADRIDLVLEDVDGRWKGDWFPGEGARVSASIICKDWKKTGDSGTLECGTFSIDEVKVSGPPDSIALRGVSARISGSLRREKKTKAWENIGLSAIVSEIAGNHGLESFFDAETGGEYERQDQRDESDLAFVKRLAKDRGLSVKIIDAKIIVFSGKKYDAKDASFSIERGVNVSGYNFSAKSHDIYRAAEVLYWGPEKKEVFKHTFTPSPAPEVGQTLRVTKRCESLADAQKRASAELRAKNKDKITGNIAIFGNPGARAGLNLNVKGFGIFDGKHAITEAVHTVSGSGGYSVSAKTRKTIDY